MAMDEMNDRKYNRPNGEDGDEKEYAAPDHGYAYIFDTKILLYYGNGDDITPLVKKELGIK